MKKILVYILTKGNHPTLYDITEELASGFERIGLDVIRVDISNRDEVQNAYYMMQDGEIEFSIGINSIVSNMTNVAGECIYKNLDTPYVSIMLDAPYNVSTGNSAFECKKHLLCLLDRSHLSIITELFPEKKFWGKIFLPLGGIQCDEDIFGNQRKYDVIWASSIYENGNPPKQWHNEPTLKPYRKILDDVAEFLIYNTVSVVEGFDYVLKQRGLYDKEFTKLFLPFYFMIFYYIKAIRRVRSIEFLIKNDINIDIFGKGWESVSLLKSKWGKNINLHGEVSYQQVLQVTKQAKIVYQDQAEFNNGAHDRVFSSMLNGAVVVTEFSTYLAEEFEEDKEIFFYDWKSGLNQVRVINDLLNDESKRLSVAVSAYGKAAARHRWSNRATSVVEVVELLKFRDKLGEYSG